MLLEGLRIPNPSDRRTILHATCARSAKPPRTIAPGASFAKSDEDHCCNFHPCLKVTVGRDVR